MSLNLRLLLPLALIVAGMILFNYDFFVENSPLLRVSCLFFSFFCFTIGIGWLYTSAAGGLEKADLKLLDWGLIGMCLSMLVIFEILDLWINFWAGLVASCVIGRFIVAVYIGRKAEK